MANMEPILMAYIKKQILTSIESTRYLNTLLCHTEYVDIMLPHVDTILNIFWYVKAIPKIPIKTKAIRDR